MPTADGPAREWADIVSHRDESTVTLDPATVAALCGEPPDCPKCGEKDAAIAELRARLALFDPVTDARERAPCGR